MDNVRITNNRKQVDKGISDALAIALESVGAFVESEAQDELENDPRRIDTGNLRNSITHEVVDSEKAVYIGTNVAYGIYVHEGTVRMDPNRFLKKAVEKNTDQIEKYIKDALKGQ